MQVARKGSSKLTVDELRRVVDNGLDQLLPLEVLDGNASQAAVNFKAFDEDALADELEGGGFLQDAIVGSLVEDNGVLSLIFDLSLGPLLLLCGLSTAGRSGGCFCFGLEGEKCHELPIPPKYIQSQNGASSCSTRVDLLIRCKNIRFTLTNGLGTDIRGICTHHSVGDRR